MSHETKKPFQSGREIYERYIPGYRATIVAVPEEPVALSEKHPPAAADRAIHAFVQKVEALKHQSAK